MLPESLSLRSATIAYLFPGQPAIKREDGTRFYDLVTHAEVEVSEFSYQPSNLTLKGAKGVPPKNTFTVTVDHHGPALRLLIEENFPTRAVKLFQDQADDVWACFNQIWPASVLGNAPILTEVKLRMTAAALGGNATQYLIQRICRLSQKGLEALGRPVQGVGLRIVLPITLSTDPVLVPLSGATGNLLIETLMEDPGQVFFEFTVQWPAVPLPPGVGPEGAHFLNAEGRKPSICVQDVYDYLTNQVTDFLRVSSA